MLAHYGGNRLPELEYVKNTLKREFDLDERFHEEFVDLFKANYEFIGLKEGQALGAERSGDRRKGPPTARGAVDGAVTVPAWRRSVPGRASASKISSGSSVKVARPDRHERACDCGAVLRGRAILAA